MSNDPNDRFMISDLSSKLSAYINGENSDQSSQTRDPAEIEDVLASEIKPAEPVRKLPGDELFTDLDQALDSGSGARDEKTRTQRLAEEQRQRQRAEEARRQQLRNEQLRQRKLQEEQLRQQKLRREKAIARSLAEGLYNFELDQPFTSVRSGHSARLSKLSPEVKSMPSEEALKNALAKMQGADKFLQDAPYYEAPKAEPYYEAPKAETTQSSYEEPAQISSPSVESRYAKSPDPLYRGYQDESKGGSRIAVIITILIALLAVAAIFIMIRRYSSRLTNLLTGAPAAGTTETASVTESKAESKAEESADSESTDNSAAIESQTAVSMAINEEGEIYNADSIAAEAEDSDELIPEDPNDISYLASVNEKEAADAIAELSDAAPRLYLSSYGIKIKAGDSFNALTYVERIEDDADERDRLYRDISVDGLGEFDAKVPGTYELTYFCYDSAGNRSNRARLTVIVE